MLSNQRDPPTRAGQCSGDLGNYFLKSKRRNLVKDLTEDKLRP